MTVTASVQAAPAQVRAPSRRLAAGAALLVWGAAGYAAVFWGLRLSTPPSAPAASASAAPVSMTPAAGASTGEASARALARVLGAPAVAVPGAATPAADAAPAAATDESLRARFTLTGVLVGGDNGGVALIGVDGKPPRPFRVGSRVDGTLVLQSVTARRAVLSATAGATRVTLDLPQPQR